jgi:hypothetical protein
MREIGGVRSLEPFLVLRAVTSSSSPEKDTRTSKFLPKHGVNGGPMRDTSGKVRFSDQELIGELCN